ncbi:hypothetical protein SAMN05421770_10383 [Granulicella rosea]|uniref:Uncharacterized protein n=2 Tax=Granulicella rosea TaxID=474952 RepID=A0A239IF81_9BACT|nr:hypothetical protein SAMN05421770_10383 [Granulicella rosea]
MADLAFAQSERRSYAGPLILALAAIVGALVIARHFFAATSIKAEHLHTDILATKTEFKSDSNVAVLGVDHTQSMLYVLTRARVSDNLHMPIFLDSFHATIVEQDGSEITAKGLDKKEIAAVQLTFPALKPLITPALERELTIEPGHNAEGMILLPFPISQAVWDTRKSATVRIDFYHQPPFFYDIPPDATKNDATPKAAPQK